MISINPIKIYTSDLESRPAKNENSINYLLRPFVSDLSQYDREKKYGNWVKDFTLCSDLADADFYLLPMNWEYYESNNIINLAVERVEKASKLGKPTIIINPWDFTAKLPFSGVIILETSGYFSRRTLENNTRLGLPAFIGDYLQNYCGGQISRSPQRNKPLVGFCGQASQNHGEYFYREIRRIFRKLLFAVGLITTEPPPFETTKFRGDVLGVLSKSVGVDTNFVLRQKYRAGYHAPKKDPQHQTRLEFIQNILNTDFTVCMRGGGNFSVRFYETLSLGRIPVFINTDCLLPFHESIEFKNYFVWVEKSEVPIIDQRMGEFISRFPENNLFEAQKECRQLWKTYFSTDGYFHNLAIYLRTQQYSFRSDL